MKEYFRRQLKPIRVLQILLVVFLPVFSFAIFSPTEVFFGNLDDFGVIYSSFGPTFLKWGLIVTGIATMVCTLLPDVVNRMLLGAVWLLSVCGYVQTMFLNRGLDHMGMDADAYIASSVEIVKSFAVWGMIAIIGIGIIILKRKNQKWLTVMALSSLVVIGMQGVAYASLMLNGEPKAFTYAGGEITLDASKQFEVSAQGNIIVFILDNTSGFYWDYVAEQYPIINERLQDFTYYNNCDCNYWGTFPSVEHIVTGYAFDPEIQINEWMQAAWSNKTTTAFYDGIHAKGYKAHIYTPENRLLAAGNSLDIAAGKIDNLTTTTAQRDIDYDLLYQTLAKAVAYRALPNYFKTSFDVPNSQYASIVTYVDNEIAYLNPDFYAKLKEEGLTTTKDNKYVIYYHLNGMHEMITDENGKRVPEEEGTIEGTVLGMSLMLEEYMNQLKNLGVYDNSTIIITADHGIEASLQTIFFVKEAGVRQNALQTNFAYVSLHELMPTIAKSAGLNTSSLGDTIYDINPAETRVRQVMLRDTDYAYPKVFRYDGTPKDNENVYRVITYNGWRDTYEDKYWGQDWDTIPAADGFY